MPGILPMKLIKCGSSQTRIAQACDRCRSKKIRCDGIRPSCSQCSNVGFECTTSDKLSRRAFPRGYTESLEERVRSLEQEVREMKDLLDARDDQLDMLSRIHSFSPYSPPASAVSGGSHKFHKSVDSTRSGSAELVPEDTLSVHEVPSLVGSDGDDGDSTFYVGPSSGKPLLEYLYLTNAYSASQELFKKKSGAEFNTDIFFETLQPVRPADLYTSHKTTINAPPRLLSDHLLVSYFQEYHPLFPVLHRPTFLASYEKLVSGNESQINDLPHHAITQLFLVFAIAVQQSESRICPDQPFNDQWQRSLNATIMESTIETLQSLVLAQLYCFSIGDYARLLQYKSLAVGIALRLGLNQSQRGFSLGALSGEMRKRAFWCVYCLDSFSAAMLGLPKLLKDEDIDTEYPSDIDDEYVSEKGFLHTLPGDSTKISSALALFRSSRILSKVLAAVYPTSSSYELSYSKLKELGDDLDGWRNGLAPHLRLEFANGAPATSVVESRSPLLGLAYHYTRVLIHRPVAGSGLDRKASASLHLIRESSKCIIQIVQLLSERKFGFSFCLNKPQLLVMSAFAVLYSTADCPRHAALAKESQGLVSGVLEELGNCSPRICNELRPIIGSLVGAGQRATTTDDRDHDNPKQCSMSHLTPSLAGATKEGPLRRRISSLSADFGFRKGKNGGIRRASSQEMSRLGSHHGFRLTSASLTDLSPTPQARHLAAGYVTTAAKAPHIGQSITLDSLNFEALWDTVILPDHSSTAPQPSRPSISAHEWERMLATMENPHAALIFDPGDCGSGTLINPSHSSDSSSPAGTGTRPVDQHWSLNETPTTTAADLCGAPPSISSFPTLSEESFAGEDLGAGTTDLDVGGGYPKGDGDLRDFLGPLMDGQGGRSLLGSEWHI